jgi:hypothetical protein
MTFLSFIETDQIVANDSEDKFLIQDYPGKRLPMGTERCQHGRAVIIMALDGASGACSLLAIVVLMGSCVCHESLVSGLEAPCSGINVHHSLRGL